MTALVLIGLMVGCVVMWQRMTTLESRLEALELGGHPSSASWASQQAWERFAEPEPHPAAPPVVPIETVSPAAPPPPPPPPVTPRPAPAIARVAPTIEHEPEPIYESVPVRSFGFEDIFGRYLPIWAGGITLAVAGFLIVKYSIDAGLLSPPIRVMLGLLFGSGLIAGAEVALRRDDIARDPRIRQALSGAGLATLYASVLVAANLYHLIGPMTAFAGLSLVTLMAGLLSMRFGAPSAVLGLVGGLAAPALVGSTEPDVPLLASWLALTVGGLAALGRRQGWLWLGALAVTGGFGWGIVLIVSGLHDAASVLSIGTLTLLLAIVFPLVIGRVEASAFRIAALVAGCAQMAAIVAMGGFTPLDWGLFGLLSAATIWLSRRESMLAEMPLAALGTGVLLTLGWVGPSGRDLAIVLTGGAVLYGTPALLRLWRSNGRLSDAVQIAAIAFAVALIPAFHFWPQMPRADFAPLALLGAATAGVAAGLGWRNDDRAADSRFAILSVSAIVLAGIAALLAAPIWALGPIVAAAAVMALLLGRVAGDARIDGTAHALMVGAIVPLTVFDPYEIGRALGLHAPEAPDTAFMRWAIGTAAMAVFARWSVESVAQRGAEAATALLLYVAAAQIVPVAWLALVPAAMLGALALAGRRAPAPAMIVSGVLAIGWTVEPLITWMAGAGGSLLGIPFYVTAAPPIGDGLARIAAPAAALILLFARGSVPERLREPAAIVAAVLATITVHALWKRVFAIGDPARFVAYGMAERTLWEALMLAATLAAWRLGGRRIAAGLGFAALLHFAWFTVALHNPLWSEQLAGPWLVPAYAIAFALVWLSRYLLPEANRMRDFVRMALILALAASLLRQLFHGSMLSDPGVSAAEDIGRSLLAILLAIGFLQWGIRRAARDWRIVSLVLMLGAVGKVFIFDAAGLDGLLRIASFAALGFSLIGVGWLYSRYLPDAAQDDSLTDESYSADTNPAGIRG